MEWKSNAIGEIASDDNLFYQFGEDCIPYVWQVSSSNERDMNGTPIPFVWKVRKIGFWKERDD